MTILSIYEKASNPLYMNKLVDKGLAGFGHGETLECTVCGKENFEYIWIGSNAVIGEGTAEDSNWWATSIERLLIRQNDLYIAEEKELIHFKYSTSDGKALTNENVSRVVASISEDCKKIGFTVYFPSSIYYCIYNYEILNNILSTNGKKQFSMKEMTAAHIVSFKGNKIKKFQSMELGNGRDIYIASGNLNLGVQNKIEKYIYNSNTNKMPNVSGNLSIEIETGISFGASSSAEIEGIKIYGNNIYFLMNFPRDYNGNYDGNHANRTVMYMFPKTIIN